MKRKSNTKRNHFKRIASFLAVICCLAGNILPAGLASGTVLAAPPRVVFENREKADPYLYISKEIESAVEDMPVPDEKKNQGFDFTLKINDTLQKSLEYTLFEYDPTYIGSSGGQEQPVDLEQLLSGDLDQPADPSAPAEPEAIFWDGKWYVEDKRPVADPYRTDNGSGEFTLKAGQMARFYIEHRNSYEVSEVEASLPEDFRLARTEGSDLAGTMGKSGRFITFINQWLPPEAQGETTRLEVEKQVIFPARYESPDALFPFQLELKGLTAYEPYANQPYTVVDAVKTSTPVVIEGVTDAQGRAVTDANGIFYLKDGCKAIFPEIPNGTEYRVKELLREADITWYPQPAADIASPSGTSDSAGSETADEHKGRIGTDTVNPPTVDVEEVLAALQPQFWRLASDTKQVQEDVTKAPLTQNVFKNISAAFVVTKTVENPTGQDEELFKDANFTFLLTKEGGAVWPYARYYLYDTAGKPVMETVAGKEVITIRNTDVNGKFTLKAGQAAVFFAERSGGGESEAKGIASGTKYTVKEEPTPGFRQSVPKAIDTYTNMEVKADSVNVHPFINEVKEPGGLAVTKKIVNVKGEAPLPGDETVFTFQLKDKNDNAVIGAGYTITVGGSTKTGSTDAEGKFTLKSGETAEFDKIKVAPGSYTIQEVGEFQPGYWFNRVEWKTRGGALNSTESDSEIKDTDMNDGGKPDINGSRNTGGLNGDADIAGNTEDLNIDTDEGENASQSLRIGSDDEPDVTDSSGDDDGYITGSDDDHVSVIIPPAGDGNKESPSYINDPIPITLTEDGLDMVYYNNYAPDRTDIVLTKMDNMVANPEKPGIGTPLANAEFRLYRVETVDGAEVETEVVKDKIYTTSANGTLNIEDLSSGTYRLKETKAPDGYMIMEPIEIIIDRKGSGKAEITVNGTKVPEDNSQLTGSRGETNRLPCTAQFISRMKQENGDSPSLKLSLSLPGANQTYLKADDQLILYAYDDYLYELPHSGGRGIYWYLIGGVLLMMAASLILYKDKLKYAGRLR